MKSKRRVCIHVSDAMRGEGVKWFYAGFGLKTLVMDIVHFF